MSAEQSTRIAAGPRRHFRAGGRDRLDPWAATGGCSPTRGCEQRSGQGRRCRRTMRRSRSTCVLLRPLTIPSRSSGRGPSRARTRSTTHGRGLGARPGRRTRQCRARPRRQADDHQPRRRHHADLAAFGPALPGAWRRDDHGQPQPARRQRLEVRDGRADVRRGPGAARRPALRAGDGPPHPRRESVRAGARTRHRVRPGK